MYSDNGTNFTGAVNLFKTLDWIRIQQEASTRRIIWRFNPPSAAWWGGWWERLIRSIKDLLKRMLGHQKLNYEQLSTALTKVESVINGRPLTFVTEDPGDLTPLTPAMFLQDLQEVEFPECECLELDGDGLRRKYKKLSILHQELQDRFRKEYLSQLVQRGKAVKPTTFAVGDVVLVGADNKKRLDWPMGKIIELLPGRDNVVRVARVKTTTGVILRPVQRLFPLEVSSSSSLPSVPDKIDKEGERRVGVLPNPVVITKRGRTVKAPERFGQ